MKSWAYEIHDKDSNDTLVTVSGFESESDAEQQATMDAQLHNIKNYYIRTVEIDFERTNTVEESTNTDIQEKAVIYEFSTKTKKPCGDEPSEYPESVKIKFPNGTILTYTMEWQIPQDDESSQTDGPFD